MEYAQTATFASVTTSCLCSLCYWACGSFMVCFRQGSRPLAEPQRLITPGQPKSFSPLISNAENLRIIKETRWVHTHLVTSRFVCIPQRLFSTVDTCNWKETTFISNAFLVKKWFPQNTIDACFHKESIHYVPSQTQEVFVTSKLCLQSFGLAFLNLFCNICFL